MLTAVVRDAVAAGRPASAAWQTAADMLAAGAGAPSVAAARAAFSQVGLHPHIVFWRRFF